MAFPLMSRISRPELTGRAEKRRAQVPKFHNEYPDNRQNQQYTGDGLDLGRTASSPNNKRETNLQDIMSLHMPLNMFGSMKLHRSVKYPLTMVLSIGRKLIKEFQNASRSQIFFD